MTQSIYIIGAPGSGKSTLMASLLEGWTIGPYTKWTAKEMCGHYLEHPTKGRGAYLGRIRDEYPGTDALSMSVAPQANLWVKTLPMLGLDWVFGEGARLSHIGFLSELARVSDLTVIYLQVNPEEAARRRAQRGGKVMSPAYVNIAASKARGAARACWEDGIRLEIR